MYPRLIVATAADSSYAAFAFNWHASVKAAGVRHPMLFCLDDGLKAKLEPHGIITYAYPYAQLPVASAVHAAGDINSTYGDTKGATAELSRKEFLPS